MASVTSLDKDLRRMRLDKFTPAAASEARAWIEETLGDRLPSPDLLEGLRDGVALCRLVNLAVPAPGVRFKQSAMPFVQMENISHFLAACQAPPLNLHQHDTFLTVDLYEQKDPAQVLQCLGAFSRAANAANPTSFPTTIGPRTRAGGMSPQATGRPATPTALGDRGASLTGNASSAYAGARPILPHRSGDSPSGRLSPTKSHAKSPSNGGSPGRPVSSWSRKEQEGATSPAWNIAQYGYMGGASQGNLGISFGGRRQITSAGPSVPSLAEKERRRKEDDEERRRRAEAEQQEEQQQEERAQRDEEQRWEQETERLRDEERRKADDEKRQWEEQERQWQLTEQKRRQEEREAQARLDEERRRFRSRSDVRLHGQFLSQYRAEQADADADADADSRHSSRVKELEKELELARQREAEYERERQQRRSRAGSRPVGHMPAPASGSRRPELAPAAAPAPRARARAASWSRDEGEFLHTQWKQHQGPEPAPEPEPEPAPTAEPEPEPGVQPPAVASPRPLPEPGTTTPKAATPSSVGSSGSGSRRPLPDPAKYASPAASLGSRTGRLAASLSSLSVNSASSSTTPPTSSQSGGGGGGGGSSSSGSGSGSAKSAWASKSLLEREMELERQRQREWEEAQRETARAVPAPDGVDGIGGGIGGRWDVGQWAGYTGDDGQNRGSHGIGAGRRQIVGPRPLPGPHR